LQAVTTAEPDDAGGPSTTLRFDRGPANAPDASANLGVERRELLERELDRVQGAFQAEQTSYSQQLNWLILSQGLFLIAYLLVLVLGVSAPLPAKRLLLAGLAAFAAGVAGLIYVALRGGRDAVHALREQRREIETTLHRDFGRTPIFVPRNVVTRGLSGLAAGILPAVFVAGWLIISLYALAAPLGASAPADGSSAPESATVYGSPGSDAAPPR
jgi:hypothetical protein